MWSPSKAMMKLMRDKKLLPSISDTERQALEAGDVSVDGGIYSGKINWNELFSMPYGGLTAVEQAFINGPCNELCAMIDPWKVYNTRRVPEDALEFVKANGFLGMIIPREYGGLGFSKLAVSTVIARLMPYCSQVASVVIICNSLSAAELIIHYGTPEQKRTILPLLARGELIPCFGLTELTAGSDAEAIKAKAIVFKNDAGEVMLRCDFDKRFMTLGSIANVATLACKVYDPENILGKGEFVGITTVMIYKGTPGFHNGDHHMPIGAGFENGPLTGRTVEVPIDNVIGGREMAGHGWTMLMTQLAGGRGISLPAGAVGGMNVATAAAGAYSMVRNQFGFQIGKMQGVEEFVGRIAYHNYMFEAARVWLCTTIDNGISPPVTSGMLKMYATDAAARIIRDGMNVMAGAGVMLGESNILGLLYMSAPVGETVEGQNIMQRSFLTNGQGAVRCHPYSYKVTRAVETDDVRAFRNNLLAWGGHVGVGFCRTRFHAITRGMFIGAPGGLHPTTRKACKRIGWAASRFGLLSDAALLLIRGNLKKEGRINNRYADAFAHIWIACATLRRFEAEGQRREDLPLVRAAVDHCLYEVQKAYEGIYANFKAPVIGWIMRNILLKGLRINPLSLGVTDKDSHEVALTVQKYDEQYLRLAANVHFPAEDRPGLGRLTKAFRMRTEAQPLFDQVASAQKRRTLPKGEVNHAMVDQAEAARVLTAAEAQQVKEAIQACLDACQVDVFTNEQYYRSWVPGVGTVTIEEAQQAKEAIEAFLATAGQNPQQA